MLRKVVSHIRGQWMGALALFLVLTGGIAYAANTIGSGDIIDNSVRSADLRNDDIRSGDVRNNNLTGGDIKDHSGVNTCPDGTARFGDICAVNPNPGFTASWALGGVSIFDVCADLGLRVPSLTEAITLAKNHDVPGIDGEQEWFWTEESTFYDDAVFPQNTGAAQVREDGFFRLRDTETTVLRICVATPTN